MSPEEFEANCQLVTSDPTWTLADELEYKSFPPVSDTIVFIKQVDWQDVRQRCRAGLNNVGLVVAVIGEKLHDFGAFLRKFKTIPPDNSGGFL